MRKAQDEPGEFKQDHKLQKHEEKPLPKKPEDRVARSSGPLHTGAARERTPRYTLKQKQE